MCDMMEIADGPCHRVVECKLGLFSTVASDPHGKGHREERHVADSAARRLIAYIYQV